MSGTKIPAKKELDYEDLALYWESMIVFVVVLIIDLGYLKLIQRAAETRCVSCDFSETV